MYTNKIKSLENELAQETANPNAKKDKLAELKRKQRLYEDIVPLVLEVLRREPELIKMRFALDNVAEKLTEIYYACSPLYKKRASLPQCIYNVLSLSILVTLGLYFAVN